MVYYPHKVRDPIYGFIEFNDLEKKFIDNEYFQRLRRIKQLAMTEYIYPGACHTRFEHSLGVMHLASEMFDKIKSNNQKILSEYTGINEESLDRHRQIIRLAALLHDIGHGPFSHVSDDLFPKESDGKQLTHEDYTAAIIKGPLKEVLECKENNSYNIRCEEIASFFDNNVKAFPSMVFWKSLISGQLDADRADYLLRDSHHSGVMYGLYDFHRLLATLSVGINPDSDDLIIGIKDGGWHVAESLIISRYQLFTQVYFHKTRRAYDFHLNRVIKNSLPGNVLPSLTKLDEYMRYDDPYVLNYINNSFGDEDALAIKKRSHIRAVYSTKDVPDDKENMLCESIVNKLDREHIWSRIDVASKIWYTFKKEEIMIIDKDKKVKPITEYSSIVPNFENMDRRVIYTNHSDKVRAEELIKDLLLEGNSWEKL